MAIKYPEDYLDELEGFFPQIGREELRRIVNSVTTDFTRYMRRGHKGVSISSSVTLDRPEGGLGRSTFYLLRLFGKKHSNSIRKAIRNRNKKRDELYGKE